MTEDQRWVGFEEQLNRYERGGALAETFRGRPETFRLEPPQIVIRGEPVHISPAHQKHHITNDEVDSEHPLPSDY